VNLAHAFAIENPHIQAEMIEAIEFPELSNQFKVSGVPQTTINSGQEVIIGSSPANELVSSIKQALSLN